MEVQSPCMVLTDSGDRKDIVVLGEYEGPGFYSPPLIPPSRGWDASFLCGPHWDCVLFFLRGLDRLEHYHLKFSVRVPIMAQQVGPDILSVKRQV